VMVYAISWRKIPQWVNARVQLCNHTRRNSLCALKHAKEHAWRILCLQHAMYVSWWLVQHVTRAKPRIAKSGGEGALSSVTKPCFQLSTVA